MDNQAEGSLYDEEYEYEDEAMTTISGLGENLNLHANFTEISYPIRYISFVLSVLTCALGLVGNALVIWVTGFHMKKHTCKIWFLNLAVADIAFVFCLPLYSVAVFTDKWPFGRFLCKVYNYVSTCNMYVSIFIITTLTIDRVLATAKPIWHHKFRSRCICYLTCAVIWIITALSSLPIFFFSDEVIYGKNVQCKLVNVEQSLTTLSIRKRAANYSAGNDTPFHDTASYFDTFPMPHGSSEADITKTSFLTKCILIPVLVAGYFIPLFVILISNIIIAKQVKKSKSVKPHRLYVILITVILFFFLTWTPVVIAQIILLVSLHNQNLRLMSQIYKIMPLMASIAYTNSCINPFIYALVGTQVRGEITEFINSIRQVFSKSSTSRTPSVEP